MDAEFDWLNTSEYPWSSASRVTAHQSVIEAGILLSMVSLLSWEGKAGEPWLGTTLSHHQGQDWASHLLAEKR